MTIPCWACRREVPDDQSYSLRITERWGHRLISLGVVLCMDCRFTVSKTLAAIQDEANGYTIATTMMAAGQGGER